jgi:hypothetical protein
MAPDRLPRDWRTAVALVAAGFALALSVRSTMVSIARAEVQIATAGLPRMEWRISEVYWACVRDGRCRPEPLLSVPTLTIEEAHK